MFSVSATTRPPRPQEVEGTDYHFFSKEQFEAGITRNEFVEWAEVFGNYYGSLRQPLEEATGWEDRIYLLEIDVQGALKLQDQGYSGTFVLIVPPSIEELRERLERRGVNDRDDLERRLSKAAWEISQKDRYDHVVVNDDLERAISEVRDLLLVDPPA